MPIKALDSWLVVPSNSSGRIPVWNGSQLPVMKTSMSLLGMCARRLSASGRHRV